MKQKIYLENHFFGIEDTSCLVQATSECMLYEIYVWYRREEKQACHCARIPLGRSSIPADNLGTVRSRFRAGHLDLKGRDRVFFAISSKAGSLDIKEKTRAVMMRKMKFSRAVAPMPLIKAR